MGAGQYRNAALVYRPTEGKDAFKDVVHGFAAPDGPHWISIERESGGLRDNGAGEEATASARGECWAAVEIHPRYVLVVAEGPEAGTSWKVVDSFSSGRNKRTFGLEAYTGPAPPAP